MVDRSSKDVASDTKQQYPEEDDDDEEESDKDESTKEGEEAESSPSSEGPQGALLPLENCVGFPLKRKA